MTKIIAGTSSKKLADQLSKNLAITQIEAFIGHFADGELRVELANCRPAENIIIVQSITQPANDTLMELLLLVDAAKRLSARHITALVPYLGYSRQDKPSHNGPISAHLVATLIEAAGVDHLITIDLHSQPTERFFKIGVQNIETSTLFAEFLKDRPNLIIVSPRHRQHHKSTQIERNTWGRDGGHKKNQRVF